MLKSFILSFIGNDQPGLVNKISNIISEHHGSWKESQLSHLEGKFAGILHLSIPADESQSLRRALDAFSDKSLHFLLEETTPQTTSSEFRELSIDVIGHDRPGIVLDVSQALADLGLNVLKMSTDYTDAPMSSEKLFQAKILAESPVSLKLDKIQRHLENIGNELMIEING